MNIDIGRAVKAGFALAFLLICTGCGSDGGSCMGPQATRTVVKEVVVTEQVHSGGPLFGLAYLDQSEQSAENTKVLQAEGALPIELGIEPDIILSSGIEEGSKVLVIKYRDQTWTVLSDNSYDPYELKLKWALLEIGELYLQERRATLDKEIKEHIYNKRLESGGFPPRRKAVFLYLNKRPGQSLVAPSGPVGQLIQSNPGSPIL